MSIGNIFGILASIVLVYVLVTYRVAIKGFYMKLTFLQLIGVIFSYLVAIAVAFVLIYYVGNWLATLVTIQLFRFGVQIIITIATLFACIGSLNWGVKKITKGKL